MVIPMNKRKAIIIVLLVTILLLIIGASCFFIYNLSPVGTNENLITYELKAGTSKVQVAEDLKAKGLIRNAFVLKIYMFFNSDLNLQAGIYEFQESMEPINMLKKMDRGDVKNDRITVTLIEGRRLKEYVKNISDKLEITEADLLNQLSNKSYLQELIEKYWFLDESILNQEIYYPLEGYLFPDTYEFREKNTASEIIEKILNHTKEKLDPYKEQIELSNFTVHQILSMASIIELEAVNENDRNTVSQVIYKRLEIGESLGMDVTTYYAVKKEMGSGLTTTDLATVSPYNTHARNKSMAGKLPVGPICNPSLMSINAVFNPTDTDYLFFYADIKTGIVYFSRTYEEHLRIQKEIG